MTPEFKALLLKSRHQVYTLLSGHNLSKLHGEGYDFAELREYQIGDDIRKINWTITAKLGKPYIKELHANRELSVVVAAMLDGAVYFGAGNAKQRLMAQTAALLGYAAQQGNDLFTGVGYLPDGTISTAPTKHIFDIERFCEQIDNARLLDTRLDLQDALNALFTRLHKPSLLFILHDFLTPVDLSLLAQRHEVIAIIIRDREEEIPHSHGEVTLHNPQEGTSQETYLGSRSTKRYRAKREANDAQLFAHFSRYDIRYVKIFTDEEPIEKLLMLFR
ncbi:MAG: DUF58 domain-containing protein [Sulfurovum sp.]|nr:DUF58 domain-containing protein [Sulfurovum sp.]